MLRNFRQRVIRPGLMLVLFTVLGGPIGCSAGLENRLHREIDAVTMKAGTISIARQLTD